MTFSPAGQVRLRSPGRPNFDEAMILIETQRDETKRDDMQASKQGRFCKGPDKVKYLNTSIPFLHGDVQFVPSVIY